MKNLLFVIVAVSLLAACPSPVLRWIDTPAEGAGGRLTGDGGDKEILSLSFGIEGETVLPFGKIPNNSGKIPISVIFAEETVVNALRPVIKFIGKSLSPPSGQTGDFSQPKLYTVTAQDDSSRDYLVTAYVKTEDSKAIVRFALDISGGALTAEGFITEGEADKPGTIVISVPAGTDTRAMTAHIAHTGALVQDSANGSHPDETFDFSGDFSAPATWTVIAKNYSAKTYTVTVVREKSSEKEITAFNFGFTGENDIIGAEPQPDGKYPIVAIVPNIVPLGPLTPDLASTAPLIHFKGSSISPDPAAAENFSNLLDPVTYTVTAEDRSTREYVVKVVLKENIPLLPAEKQITGFYFTDPLVEGVIDEAAKTIALTVPRGTALSAVRPEIYYRGVSVSPMPGQPVDFRDATPTTPVIYNVRDSGGSFQPYEVSVFSTGLPAPPVVDVPGTSGEKVDVGVDANGAYTVIVEFPTYSNNPVININTGDTINIGQIDTTINPTVNLENNNVNIGNDNVFNYIPILMDNGDYMYVLVVNPPPGGTAPAPAANAASIDAFYFTNPAAIGTIGKTDGTEGAGTAASPYTITVNVPYGTNARSLAPVICYTGKEIVGIPGPSPLKVPSASFTDPVDYTVKALDGATTKTYRVTVAVARNDAREITDFTFSEVPLADTKTIISAMPNAEGNYPIEITVPTGQPITSLTPKIVHTGNAIAGAGFSPSGGPGTQTAQTAVPSFGPTTPVEYTVTAEDLRTRTYAVTVRNANLADDDIKEITGFYFTNPLAVGTINQDTNTITVLVPSKTNTAGLVPSVYIRGISVNPGSGTANNFSSPAVYTVTARNGTTRSYTVTVRSTPSSTKDITRFDFPGIINTETVIGAVPNADGTYPLSVWVPLGTELSSLAPNITHTGTGIDFAGGIVRDFSGPVTYTVKAEDGSTKTYTVTVTPLSGDGKIITSLIFNAVPLTGGGTIRVVAAINQDDHTITATVPSTAGITALAPTITYIGRSIEGPAGGEKTANPFTGAAENFTAGKTYTVKDQSGAPLPYTVTVERQSSVTVTFTGETDVTAIDANAYDQSTGIITVTVKTGTIASPYEWYVDGVKQAVSTSETTFTLNVGGGNFTPGRHEITLSGIKGGLHYTGRVYFTVAGGSK
jgi:hypothetical protein